ncbi:MAG: EAL domain-containing protein [Ewingella sp.]
MFRANINKSHTRIILAVIASLLIVALGIFSVSWQTSHGLKNDAHERLSMAVEQIDMMFNNAEKAAKAVEPLLGQPCSAKVVLELRRQTVVMPNVRTINLATNGGKDIYCTTLFGPSTGIVDNNEYVGGQLLLMSGNDVTPDHPLIVYRDQQGKNSILVGVDGYYLHNILNLLSTHVEIMLQVGDQWLDTQGEVHDGIYRKNGEKIQHASSHYPYQVMLFIQHTSHWRQALYYSPISLFLFPLLGLFVGIMTYLALGRVGTPLAMMKAAVANHEFVPYIQPVVDGTTHQMTGGEILMRWQHPQMGLISPYQFIPLAEETGLIIDMTRQLMAQTRDIYAPLAAQLPDDFHFAFNICANHFKDLSLVEDCKAFIHAFKIKPIKLVLELTERELIVPSPITDNLFKALRRLGVLVALDDFGTGHSSLTYLQKFHIDFLKIDQSFIARIGTDSLSGHIVDNVIDLAKRLEMVIVAEGIETQTQIDYLAPYQLDYLQGYFFGKPMPLEEFNRQWLEPKN